MKRKININTIFICVAIGVIVFTHSFMLTSVPYGINIDEAGACYDAWSLAKYGVDRYGNSYPVYFQNYGGGQNPLLTYILMFCFKFADYSLWMPRLVMLVACLITAFYGYRLTYLIKKDEEVEHSIYGILFLLLFSIMPFFIMIFRIGMESTLMLPTSTFFLYYFAKALKYKRKRNYFIAGIAAGIVLYSYALSYIVMPIMLLFVFLYGLWIQKKEWKSYISDWIVFAIPLAILAAPLIVVQLINLLDLPEMQVGCFTFTKINKYRSSEVSLEHFWRQIVDAFRYTHFYDELPYNTSSKFGTMYFVSVPFAVVGFFLCLKKLLTSLRGNSIELEAVPVIWCIAEYTMGGMIGGGSEPYSSRMVGVFVVLCYFLTTGLYVTADLIKNKVSTAKVQKIFSIGMAVVYMMCFASFVCYYFVDYTEGKYPLLGLFEYDVSPVVEYFENEGIQYAEMPLYSSMFYIYYALPAEIPPYELNYLDGEPQSIRNVQFYYPEDVDYNGNYAVRMIETESRDYLKSKGYKEIVLDNWCIYLTPLIDFKIELKQADSVEYFVDRIDVEKDQYVIQGWAYQKDSKSRCSQIGFNIDGKYYPAEMVERPDVVQLHGLSENVDYGFKSTIEIKELVNSESRSIMCDGEEILVIAK